MDNRQGERHNRTAIAMITIFNQLSRQHVFTTGRFRALSGSELLEMYG